MACVLKVWVFVRWQNPPPPPPPIFVSGCKGRNHLALNSSQELCLRAIINVSNPVCFFIGYVGMYYCMAARFPFRFIEIRPVRCQRMPRW
jgi:hypothetical protein